MDEVDQIIKILVDSGYELTSMILITHAKEKELIYRKGNVKVVISTLKEMTVEEREAVDKLEFVWGKGDILHVWPNIEGGE